MNPARVPLLWILVPLVLGFVFGRVFPSPLPLAVALSSVAIAVCSFFLDRRYCTSFIALSVFLGGYAYTVALDREGRVPPEYPIREAYLEIDLERAFKSSYSTLNGFGTIRSTEAHLSGLVGLRVYFSLKPDDANAIEHSFQIGARIHSTGLLSPLDSKDSSAGFDAYLSNSGVVARFERGSIHEISPGSLWARSISEMQQFAVRTLEQGLPIDEPETHSYKAMMLGLKSELETEQKALFLQNGALHLFAISGLHIGVIAICGHSLFQLLRIPTKWIPIPNLALIGLFVVTTGGAPSSLRALLMIACYYLCVASRRQAAPLNALILSALVCLLIDPRQLFLAGFQLSYATVAAILLYGAPLATHLQDRWSPFKQIPHQAWTLAQRTGNALIRFLLGSFAVSLAAFLASSALSIIYFNSISFIGVLANIALIPLASLAIISGFITLIVGAMGIAPLSVLFNSAAHLVLSSMHAFLAFLGKLGPGHATVSEPPAHLLLFGLSLFLAMLFYGYDKRWKIGNTRLFLLPVAFTAICLATALLA